MRVAIDKNGDGVIDNIVEADSLEAATELFPVDTVLDAVSSGVQIGWVRQPDGSYAKPEEPLAEPTYQSLNKLEAMALFRAVTGKGDAEELAMRKDPALELLWMKWQTDVPQSIHRDNPVVGVFLDGLIATGHATEEHKVAMLAAWPQE
jgi:hypothetical protein